MAKIPHKAANQSSLARVNEFWYCLKEILRVGWNETKRQMKMESCSGVGERGGGVQGVPCFRKGLQLTSSDTSRFLSGFQSECIVVEVDPCFRMIISQMGRNQTFLFPYAKPADDV